MSVCVELRDTISTIIIIWACVREKGFGKERLHLLVLEVLHVYLNRYYTLHIRDWKQLK